MTFCCQGKEVGCWAGDTKMVHVYVYAYIYIYLYGKILLSHSLHPSHIGLLLHPGTWTFTTSNTWHTLP